MRTNTAILLTWLLLSVALAIGCAGNAGASGDSEEDQAQLEIKGSPGTEFSGSCAVGDEEPEEIGGQTPESFVYDLRGKSLGCEISSEGNVQVRLTVGNDRSVQRIGGGTVNFTYDNGSISVVSSSVSTGGGSSSQVISSSAGETDEEPGEAMNESSDVTSESRNVSGFDAVELHGVGNLSIQQTGSESLTVEAEEDILPKIRTEVENNRLIVGPEPGASIYTNGPINYELTVKDLNALKVSGSGNIDAESISTDELAVTISGAGDVRLSGKADSQEISILGAGAYQAEDLESKEAKIAITGSGSVIVNASDELDAGIIGSGSVRYIGDPTVSQNIIGAGRVSKY